MAGVRSSIVWTIAETIVTLLASLSMLLIVARIIGPQDFGIASIVFFIGSLAENFLTLTFTEPLIQRRKLSSSIVDTAFSSMLILSLFIYAILIVVSPFIAYIYNEPSLLKLIAIQGLTCIFLGVRGVPEAILARSMQFRSLALRGIAAKIIGASTAVFFALGGAGAWSVIIGNVMYSITAAILVWVLRTEPLRLRINKLEAISLINFGRFSLADALLTSLSARIYGLIIAYFYGTKIFGEISVAFRFNDTIVSLLGQTVNRIALPVMSSVSNNRNLVFRNWLSGTRVITLIAVPAMFGVAAIGPDLIDTMLGAAWQGAAPALAAISIYSAFNLAAVLVGPALKSVGQPSKLLIVHAYSVGFLIFATILSIQYGLYATLSIYSMLGLVYWLSSMLVLQFTLNVNAFRHQGISSIVIWVTAFVMALSVMILRISLENLITLYRLLILVIAGIIIYFGLTVIFNRKVIRDVLRWQDVQS